MFWSSIFFFFLCFFFVSNGSFFSLKKKSREFPIQNWSLSLQFHTQYSLGSEQIQVMALSSAEDDSDFIIITCTSPTRFDADTADTEMLISATDILSWDCPTILSFQSVRVRAHRNRFVCFPGK